MVQFTDDDDDMHTNKIGAFWWCISQLHTGIVKLEVGNDGKRGGG